MRIDVTYYLGVVSKVLVWGRSMLEEAFSNAFRQMGPLLIVALLGLVGLAVLKGRLGESTKRRKVGFPYERRPSLFTETETRFLHILREAAPDMAVFGKVRLEDVVVVRRGLSESERQAARNSISSRHLDFVLVDPDSTRIMCAVELDDSSHASDRARRADALKNGALAAAGVPLVRVRVSGTYDVLDIRRRIEGAMTPPALVTA